MCTVLFILRIQIAVSPINNLRCCVNFHLNNVFHLTGACGGAVRWGTALRLPIVSMEIFIDIILPITLRPWDRSVELATLPPSCVDRLEIWEPQPPGILWVRNRPVEGFLYLLLNFSWDYTVRKFRSNKRFDNYRGQILSNDFLHSTR